MAGAVDDSTINIVVVIIIIIIIIIKPTAEIGAILKLYRIGSGTRSSVENRHVIRIRFGTALRRLPVSGTIHIIVLFCALCSYYNPITS